MHAGHAPRRCNLIPLHPRCVWMAGAQPCLTLKRARTDILRLLVQRCCVLRLSGLELLHLGGVLLGGCTDGFLDVVKPRVCLGRLVRRSHSAQARHTTSLHYTRTK